MGGPRYVPRAGGGEKALCWRCVDCGWPDIFQRGGGRGKRFAGGVGVNSGNCAHFCSVPGSVSSTCAWVGDIAKKELRIFGEGNLMGEGFKLRIARIRFGQRCLPE